VTAACPVTKDASACADIQAALESAISYLLAQELLETTGGGLRLAAAEQ
jgi:hypothetical protein